MVPLMLQLERRATPISLYMPEKPADLRRIFVPIQAVKLAIV
jgi:hypothetical protein